MKQVLIAIMLVLCMSCTGFAEPGGEPVVESRDYLAIFNLQERRMILAFESQLDSKTLARYAENQGRSSSLKSEDIASIFNSLSGKVLIKDENDNEKLINSKSLEGMFKHIEDGITDNTANLDSKLMFDKFKEKVRRDYKLISEYKTYAKEKEEFYKRVRDYSGYILRMLREIGVKDKEGL